MNACVERLLRISLTVAGLARAEAFYRDTLGFVRVALGSVDPAWLRLLGVEGAAAQAMRMRLGAQELELLAFDPPGRPYPPGSTASDAWFQHVAIVVSDMAAAWARLQGAPVTPITSGGPQRLPPNTGSVIAFKFRDPDGHPLELIQFPAGTGDPVWQHPAAGAVFLGIDHSAIVVADIARSTEFYLRLPGLSVLSRSLNHGPEQRRLDGMSRDVVDVVSLRPALTGTPHVELLGYRVPAPGQAAAPAPVRDIAAARLVLRVEGLSALVASLRAAGVRFTSPGLVPLGDGGRAALVRDPDGHHLLLVQPLVEKPG
jgi:catechol 2,3-dioxygenase-like lactoylglutathione lyase family enzyme